MSDWLAPEERKIWAALTVRSNEPGSMALLDKVDALVRKLQQRAEHISREEATELQDILRTLVPSGVALITNARELRDEWDKEKKRAQGWRCFHCGEFFQTSEAAKSHFGDGTFEDEPPACIRILTEGEKAVMDENRAMFSDLQATRRENEALESKLGAVYSDLSARFKGAKDVGTAWNLYDSMEGRAVAAEERAQTAEAQAAYLLYITRAWLEGLGEKRIASRTNIEALEAGIFKQLPEGARAMVEKVKILQEIASFWAPLGEHSTQAERERLQQCLDRAAKLDAKKGKS